MCKIEDSETESLVVAWQNSIPKLVLTLKSPNCHLHLAVGANSNALTQPTLRVCLGQLALLLTFGTVHDLR